MTQRSFKFGSAGNIRIIELYRNYECLWDTENVNYKNRIARNAALNEFARKLGIEGFGPREITAKIKNMRSQYLQERKKIKSSLKSGTKNVYVPKLSWYKHLDSFLRKPSKFQRADVTDETTPDTSQVNDSLLNIENIQTVQVFDSMVDEVDLRSKPTQPKKPWIKKTDFDSTVDPLVEIDKRSRQNEDDLDLFGKYVASSLRRLNEINAIYAQDEIQTVLSKYKLQNLQETA